MFVVWLLAMSLHYLFCFAIVIEEKNGYSKYSAVIKEEGEKFLLVFLLAVYKAIRI